MAADDDQNSQIDLFAYLISRSSSIKAQHLVLFAPMTYMLRQIIIVWSKVSEQDGDPIWRLVDRQKAGRWFARRKKSRSRRWVPAARWSHWRRSCADTSRSAWSAGRRTSKRSTCRSTPFWWRSCPRRFSRTRSWSNMRAASKHPTIGWRSCRRTSECGPRWSTSTFTTTSWSGSLLDNVWYVYA